MAIRSLRGVTPQDSLSTHAAGFPTTELRAAMLSALLAYDRSGVVEEAFTLAWARRAAFAFVFPAPVEVI